MKLLRWAVTICCIFLLIMVFAPYSAVATTILVDPPDAGTHDILSISGGFDATTLFLSATFRPGTFNPADLGFIFGLDTDLDVATGTQGPPAFFPLGADFTVSFFPSNTPFGNARVNSSLGGLVPVTYSADAFSLSVPLALLGNDDGVANFGLSVGVPNVSGSAFVPTDLTIPGPVGTAGPLAGPTSPVSNLTPIPEPGTLVLVASGLLGLLGYALRRQHVAD